jgi:hypothetical protein
MSTVMVTGQTAVSLYFLGIRTSTGLARDGTLETAIAYNTTGLTIAYTRERAAQVAFAVGGGTPPVTLANAGVAWTSLGFIHVGGGLYRVDFPDNAFLIGVKFVIPQVYGPADTSFIFVGLVENVGVDPRSATPPAVNTTQFAGQTVNAAGAVTVPSSIASPTNITAGVVTTVSGNVVGSVGSVTAGVTLAASAVQAIWDAATSALTTAGSIGKWILDKLDVVLSSRGTSNYAGGDTTGTTTLLTRVPGVVPTAVQNADALIARNQQGGSNNAPTVGTALAGGLMNFTIDPTTSVMTVKNGDGTAAYTRTLTRQQLNAIITAA